MNADRNLLFGVLALQLDFISQPQLIAGMQAWVAEKTLPLSAHLVKLGHLAAGKAALLEPLVDEHVRQHGDDPAQSLQALSSAAPVAVALNPLAGQDAEIAVSVGHLGRSRASAVETALPSQAGAIDPNATHVRPYVSQSLTGRFRILRSHAKGGLGQVSVAKDTELGRDVAFKEIQPQHADDRNSRGRFVLEAEITGGLEHPGIVPVYGLGTYPDGRPFYAMRFIQGDSLKQAILRFHASVPGSEKGSTKAATERNLQLRELLGRFVDVCQAVAYAHSRGVLHRDLKPDNIMLGKYGETLVVDWGLAKAAGKDLPTVETPLEPASLSGSGIAAVSSGSSEIDPTQTGQVLGTLAYMSPEQAAGKISDLGPATDIYSLGATLYHLLTGKTPFAHWTKDVDFGLRLTDIQQGRYSPPISVVPTIPAALNAICLMAMSVKPADRYPSLADLANDVEHWLADEPVAAYPEPVTARAARWGRKHRAAVTAGVSTVLVASLALVIVTGITWQKNNELKIANRKEREATSRERQAAERERLAASEAREQTEKTRHALVAVEAERAEKEVQRKLAVDNADAAKKQSQLALATLNGVVFNLSRSLKSLPGGGEVRRELLQTALKQLDRLATSYVGQAQADRTTAVALLDLAGVLLQFGRPLRPIDAEPELRGVEDQDALQLALRLTHTAHEICLKLAAAAPAEAHAQRDLGFSYNKLGDISLQMRDLDAARVSYQQSLEIRRTLAAAVPADAQVQRDLAISYYNLGEISFQTGDLQAAREGYQPFHEFAKKQATAVPTDKLAQRDLSMSYNNMGKMSLQTGDLQAARVAYQQSLEIRRTLAAAAPADMQTQHDLSMSYNNIGKISLKTGDLQAAREAYQKFHEIARKQAADAPTDAQARRDLSVSYDNLANLSLQTGDLQAAREAYQQFHEIAKKQAADTPTDAQSQRDLSVSYDNLGKINLQTGNLQTAKEAYGLSLEIRKKQAAGAPTDAQSQRDLSISFENLSKVMLQTRDLEVALKWSQRSLEIRKKQAADAPSDVRAKRDLSVSYNRLGEISLQMRDLDGARNAFQQSLEIDKKLASAAVADVQAQRDLSVSFDNLGEISLQSRDLVAAREAYQQSLEIRRTLAATAPTDAQAQRDLMLSYNKLGAISKISGDLKAARESSLQCLEIAKILAAAAPADVQAQRDLSVLYNKLGEISLQTRDLDAAREAYQLSHEIRRAMASAAPADPQAQRDLSVSYDSLGDIRLKLHDLGAAREAYQQSLEIRKTLASAAPEDPRAQRDLSVSHDRSGDISLQLRDLESARESYQQSLELRKKLAAAAPTDAQAQRDLMVSYFNLGQLSNETGHIVVAKSQFHAAVKTLTDFSARSGRRPYEKELKGLGALIAKCELAERIVGNIELVREQPAADQARLYYQRARVCLALAQDQPDKWLTHLGEAARSGETLRQQEGAVFAWKYFAACCHGLCLTELDRAKVGEAQAGQPGPAQSAEGQALREKWQTAALEALKAAIDAGFKDGKLLATDHDLDALRELPEFKEIVRPLLEDKAKAEDGKPNDK